MLRDRKAKTLRCSECSRPMPDAAPPESGELICAQCLGDDDEQFARVRMRRELSDERKAALRKDFGIEVHYRMVVVTAPASRQLGSKGQMRTQISVARIPSLEREIP
jgi:hypothetical protein